MLLHTSFPEDLPKPFLTINIGGLLEVERIQSLFDTVPRDPYVPEGFRYKSIFRARVRGMNVSHTAHGPLFQPKEFNPIHGDIIRVYDMMNEELAKLLAPAIRLFSTCANLTPEHEILVQAQRITTSEEQPGFPVVEGWHQDNCMTVGILLIDRKNVSGGVSMVSLDRGKTLDHAAVLQPGDLLLLNDRKAWHNATPLVPIQRGVEAHRDIVIITYPSCRQPKSRAA